jgi:hypothetical protein
MISFEKIDDKTYKMKSNRGREFHLMLLPKTRITKEFNIVESDISEMSKVLGEDFDQYIFDLLCEYHRFRRTDDEEKFDFLTDQADMIVGYANIFVDRNRVNYSTLVDASNTTQPYSIANQAKTVIKLSSALKIFSLLFNTRSGPSRDYPGKLFDLLSDATYGGMSAKRWINLVITSLGSGSYVTPKRTITTDSDLISLIFPAKRHAYEINFDWMEAMERIIKILPILEHNRNPIRFFFSVIHMVRKGKWRSVFQPYAIRYKEGGEDEDGKDDRIKRKRKILPSRVYQRALAMELKKLRLKIKSPLFRSIRVSLKGKSMEGKGAAIHSVQKRVRSITYNSPFWGSVTVPLLERIFKIRYKSGHDKLLGMPPGDAALLSYYIGQRLKSIFGVPYGYLFEFACYFPKTKCQESTAYRLRNVEQFIDTTLKLKRENLLRWGFPSRISFARYLERFIGTMRTATLFNIVTGQGISVDDTRLEKEAIDYFFHFLFTDKLDEGINQLGHHISALIN